MTEQAATQRQLLEQNTEITRLVYETVGEITQKMNDGFTEIKERLSHLEGQVQGEQVAVQQESTAQGIKTSKWVRASIALSSAIGLTGLIHSFH